MDNVAAAQSVPADVKAVAGRRLMSVADGRLMSIDALRGFDMFLIVGADALVYALNRMSQTPITQFLAYELEHAEWAGFHFYDLVFPLFIFIVGMSTVFSLDRSKGTPTSAVLGRIVRRTLLLFLLGIFCSGGLSAAWPDVRLMGVLNRIALVYGISALLFHFFRPKVLAAVSIGLLAGYWALLTFVPIRDVRLTRGDLVAMAEQMGDRESSLLLAEKRNISAVKDSPAWSAAEKLFHGTTRTVRGRFDEGCNLPNHIDFLYLGGRKYDVFFDPEGLLSTIPAIVSCLLGVFAGLVLKSASTTDMGRVRLLVGFGLVAAALGWLLSIQMPVVKKIWTPSFVLVAGGYSAILTGLFYLVVDVWRMRKWCQPFVWIGMNSITVYVASSIIGGFRRPAARLAGGDVSAFLNTHLANGAGDLLVSVVGLALAFWFVRVLFKRKVFIRL